MFKNKKMKKKILILLSLFVLSLSGCNQQSDTIKIQFLSFNDFHGAVNMEDDQMGLLNFATTIKNQISKNKNGSILLSAGDMYQGSAQSNLTHGKILIDVMNNLGLEAMTIGNHEFDWGVDVLKSHHDQIEENGEADFTYLGCNIFSKNKDASSTRVDWTSDYKIIERQGLKIGVIGWIGTSCINDISSSIVQQYEFQNPINQIINIAKNLKEELNCNLVVAMGHDEDNFVNQSIGLSKEVDINLIINGHTHQSYIQEDVGFNIIQSGSYGEYLGVTNFEIDRQTKEIVSYQSNNIRIENQTKKDQEIKKIIDENLKDINDIVEEKIGVAGERVSRSLGAEWAADVVKNSTGADIGIVNYGGIRAGAFPIASGSDIKVSKIWEIMPFDNVIKLVTLNGKQVKTLQNNSDSFVFSRGVDELWENIDENKLYRVAACDYIFDKDIYCFKDGQDISITPLLVRDALIADVRAWSKENLEFRPSQGTKVGILI